MPNSNAVGNVLRSSADVSNLDTKDLRVYQNPSRQKSLVRNYKILTAIYGLLSVTLLVMPDRTLTRRLASKMGGAAGFGLAAGVSTILSKASSIEHLHSPTFKRLNVGLCGFSFLGLLAVPGEAAFLPTAAPAMILAGFMNAARMLGVFVAFRGWSIGVISSKKSQEGMDNIILPRLTPQKALTEILQGGRSSVQGLRVSKETKKKSLTYRNCLLLVLTSMLSCLMEGFFCLRYRGSTLGKTAFDISLHWSAVARLFLISSMIFSLKDLADRDRMTTGTTFIKLNVMIGAWAALVGIGQGLSVTGYSHQRIEMVAFSLPFLIKGLKALKIKSDKKSQKPFLQPPPASDSL